MDLEAISAKVEVFRPFPRARDSLTNVKLLMLQTQVAGEIVQSLDLPFEDTVKVFVD